MLNLFIEKSVITKALFSKIRRKVNNPKSTKQIRSADAAEY
jgi:hypothetical protein